MSCYTYVTYLVPTHEIHEVRLKLKKRFYLVIIMQDGSYFDVEIKSSLKGRTCGFSLISSACAVSLGYRRKEKAGTPETGVYISCYTAS
jgi:hypothetical protein